jgi:hypothetical protein
MEQGSPAPTGPFSLPGFASQAGLQGYANRAAQQQQQQQPQQQQQQKPSQQQQQHMEDIVQQKQGGSGTAHKSRNKVWQHQAANQQQQQLQLQLQQQIHPMNKFTGSSAYPGPPSLRISYVSFRSAPPPQQISGNNSNNMMSFSGSTGNNAPRYPTPIQRPTAPTGNMQQRQPPPIHSSGPTGAPGSGLGKSSQHKCVELNFLEDDGMDEDDFKQLSFEDVIHQGFLDYIEFKTKKKDHGRYVLYCTSIEKDLFQLGINSGENFQTYDKIALQVGYINLIFKKIIIIYFSIGYW